MKQKKINMPLMRGLLPESLAKWNFKPPASVFRLHKLETPSCSPKCVFAFEDVDFSDEAGDGRCNSQVPKGYLAVYVGKEARRFVIPLSYLSHGIFKALLKKAEEEFGFSSNGGIRLPCDPILFEHILWLLKEKDPMVHNLEMVELLSFYHNEDSECKG